VISVGFLDALAAAHAGRKRSQTLGAEDTIRRSE
jgi:hypothetical protein